MEDSERVGNLPTPIHQRIDREVTLIRQFRRTLGEKQHILPTAIRALDRLHDVVCNSQCVIFNQLEMDIAQRRFDVKIRLALNVRHDILLSSAAPKD